MDSFNIIKQTINQYNPNQATILYIDSVKKKIEKFINNPEQDTLKTIYGDIIYQTLIRNEQHEMSDFSHLRPVYSLVKKCFSQHSIKNIVPEFTESYEAIITPEKEISFINPCFYWATIMYDALQKDKEHFKNVELHMDMYQEKHNPEYANSGPSIHFLCSFDDHTGGSYILEYTGYNKILIRPRSKNNEGIKTYTNFNSNRSQLHVPLLDQKATFDTRARLIDVFTDCKTLNTMKAQFEEMRQKQVQKYETDIKTLQPTMGISRFDFSRLIGILLGAAPGQPSIYYRNEQDDETFLHFQ